MMNKKDFMRSALSSDLRLMSGPPPIVPFADWDYYYLAEDLEWRFDDLDIVITAKKGFVTNLASVPRVFWSLMPVAARYSYPAIIHDYLYSSQSLSRAASDLLLREAMEETGVNNVKSFLVYKSVRLFGRSAWNESARAHARGEFRLLKKYPNDFKTTWDEWRARPDVFQD
jgi:hypothetical protein